MIHDNLSLRQKGFSSKQERMSQCDLRLKCLQQKIDDLECYLKSKLEPELWDRVKESTLTCRHL